MPKHLEVYKCTHCGNIVEVLHGGGADIVCCGEPMKLMVEGATDGAMEKHVPVIEKVDGGYLVKVAACLTPWKKSTGLNGLNCWPTAEAIQSSSSPATRQRLFLPLTPPR